jgi:hypothetical protein
MATAANFAANPRASSGIVSTANTSPDGSSGTTVSIFTAGASGSRLDSVQIKGIAANAATQEANNIRLFLNDGTTNHPIREILVSSFTLTVGTTGNFEVTVPLGIPLPNGWSLKASMNSAGAGFHVTAYGGDF